MNKNYRLVILIVVLLVLAGCGETFRGIGRDTSRIAYGVKTIFVSQR